MSVGTAACYLPRRHDAAVLGPASGPESTAATWLWRIRPSQNVAPDRRHENSLSYYLRIKAHARTGRGYATELGRAALDWAVTHHADLPIVAFTEVHNRASRAVMERLGVRPAGIIRRDGLVEVHL
ncbi:GNAT family N-acetyltransferase [Plantactinospora sp. CA-294935]|uniref:GNAT family N-acetyltransferase n=1 Tax=Plantactinospora sp. CA-294935 TaxID=3240012 RepID=UPI003D8B13AF